MLNNFTRFICKQSSLKITINTFKQNINHNKRKIINTSFIINNSNIHNNSNLTHPFSGKQNNLSSICFDDLFNNYFPKY